MAGEEPVLAVAMEALEVAVIRRERPQMLLTEIMAVIWEVGEAKALSVELIVERQAVALNHLQFLEHLLAMRAVAGAAAPHRLVVEQQELMPVMAAGLKTLEIPVLPTGAVAAVAVLDMRQELPHLFRDTQGMAALES